MNKSELVKELSKKSKLTQKECATCLNALTELVSETLKKGRDVRLVGFGKFIVKHRPARKSFNPQTRKQMIIPATNVPQFKAGKALKEAITM